MQAPSLRPTQLWSSCNSNLDISTAPTKAKSREPAYSQALIQNKSDRQRVRYRVMQAGRVRQLWWMVFRVETGEGGRDGGQIRIGFVEEQCFKFGVNAWASITPEGMMHFPPVSEFHLFSKNFQTGKFSK